MKRIICGCFCILFLLSACGNAGNGDVADFQEQQTAVDCLETEIANFVKRLEHGIDCDVEINGGTAIVTLHAPHVQGDDNELIALKKRISTAIQEQYSGINRVSVNCGFGSLEKISNPDNAKDNDEHQIDRDLKGNEHHEVFDIPAPTL